MVKVCCLPNSWEKNREKKTWWNPAKISINRWESIQLHAIQEEFERKKVDEKHQRKRFPNVTRPMVLFSEIPLAIRRLTWRTDFRSRSRPTARTSRKWRSEPAIVRFYLNRDGTFTPDQSRYSHARLPCWWRTWSPKGVPSLKMKTIKKY